MTASPFEFSRPVAAGDLPAGGRAFAIDASAHECARIAARLGIVAVERLHAEGMVRPEGRSGVVRLTGVITASVRQTCVVTLEPFSVSITAALERLYDATIDDEWGDAEVDAGQLVLHGDDDTFCEPLVDERIDAGEAAVEQLALELDPHPRKPDVAFTETVPATDGAPPVADSPFAALAPGWRPASDGEH